ncbi:MAG: hypothetical protein Aurels2KO_57400 [Aureliella sp.]
MAEANDIEINKRHGCPVLVTRLIRELSANNCSPKTTRTQSLMYPNRVTGSATTIDATSQPRDNMSPLAKANTTEAVRVLLRHAELCLLS